MKKPARERFAYPVVSVIVKAPGDGNEILLQERSKSSAGVFRGLLELPQGRLRRGETIAQCAARELEEEVGLRNFKFATAPLRLTWLGEELSCIDAFVVNESGRHSFLALVVVGTASGDLRETTEASKPRYYGRDAVAELLHARRIFPLNAPMIAQYFGLSVGYRLRDSA